MNGVWVFEKHAMMMQGHAVPWKAVQCTGVWKQTSAVFQIHL